MKIDGRLARKNRTKIEKDPAGNQMFQNRIERYSKSYFENRLSAKTPKKKIPIASAGDNVRKF